MFDCCSSQNVTTTGAVTTDKTFLAFVTTHPGSTDGTVVIKDQNASGAILFEATIKSSNSSQHYNFSYPIIFSDGIYVELTNATATIGYFG